LHSGIDLKQVVKLPPDEEVNDWIAVHGNLEVCGVAVGLQLSVESENSVHTII